MSKNTATPSPDSSTVHPCGTTAENTRRYYLDVMEVQCWQLRHTDDEQCLSQNSHAAANRDVAVSDVIAGDNSWPQLEASIQQCTNCQLSAMRKQAIMGRGNSSAALMFILLAPEDSDDQTGSICSGEANELLCKMLAAINLPVEEVYITSLLKCSVPARHTVSAKEIAHCHGYLKQQIQLIHPELLVVLGETAIRCLLQKDLSLDDFRAMNADPQFLIESVPVFTSYSPQELLLQAENKRKAWADLQQLQKMVKTWSATS